MKSSTMNEIKLIIPHILYEIYQFEFIYSNGRDLPEEFHDSIYLSFFIHGRIILHFLTRVPNKENKDDVYSVDLGFGPIKINIPHQIEMRFGKDMMHLTYKRLRHTNESKPWPIELFFNIMKEPISKFIEFSLKNLELEESEKAHFENLQSKFN